MMLVGALGNLGNRLKTLKGIRFSHFGDPLSRHDFRARLGECVFYNFSVFLQFLDPLPGSVLGQKCEEMEYGKTSEKRVGYFHAGHASNSGYYPMWSLKRT